MLCCAVMCCAFCVGALHVMRSDFVSCVVLCLILPSCNVCVCAGFPAQKCFLSLRCYVWFTEERLSQYFWSGETRYTQTIKEVTIRHNTAQLTKPERTMCNTRRTTKHTTAQHSTTPIQKPKQNTQQSTTRTKQEHLQPFTVHETPID